MTYCCSFYFQFTIQLSFITVDLAVKKKKKKALITLKHCFAHNDTIISFRDHINYVAPSAYA